MRSHNQPREVCGGGAKVGWRVNEWKREVGVGRSHVYDLLGAGKIKAVKSGKATIIITPPADYLAGLPAA
jgi:hypothetical protein